jgi:hypothetical protein
MLQMQQDDTCVANQIDTVGAIASSEGCRQARGEYVHVRMN